MTDKEIDKLFSSGKMPCFPPNDYSGSMATWMVELLERGIWNGRGWYGDIWIDEGIYWEILEKCEG